jgi:hypothetical protein
MVSALIKARLDARRLPIPFSPFRAWRLQRWRWFSFRATALNMARM